MILGAMQDWKLRVTHLIDHAAREHATREIVSHWADGSETRTNWAEVRRDALKMTQVLRRLAIGGSCNAMNEDAPATPLASRSWLDRLGQMLAGEPRNRRYACGYEAGGGYAQPTCSWNCASY